MLLLRRAYEETVFPRKNEVTLRGFYEEIVSSLFYDELTLIVNFLVRFS